MSTRKPALRVFLDANVLFSAAYRENAGLAILWELPDIQLLTSAYAAQESLYNLEEESQRYRLERLLEYVPFVPEISFPDMRDIQLPEKDRPILAAALSCKADWLLTGDVKHFGAYYQKIIHGTRISRPAEFLKWFAQQPRKK